MHYTITLDMSTRIQAVQDWRKNMNKNSMFYMRKLSLLHHLHRSQRTLTSMQQRAVRK
jgi:hypothetical protein